MSLGVLANLDVEAVLGGRPLPERVGRRLSAVGSLLRVYAEPGEPLWTPTCLEPGRVLAVEGLARPDYVSGEPSRPSAPRAAWCAHGDRRLLSRRLGHELAVALEGGLPGTAWVGSLERLRDALRAEPFAADGAWVLKPALSAGGRGALRGRGEALLDGTPLEGSPALAAALQGEGAQLMPWVQRLEDVGCRARIAGDEIALDGFHRLFVTSSGGFRGVEVSLGSASFPELPGSEAARLGAAAMAAGQRLLARGYQGPFGVDAFAYRDGGGARQFLALCELNVRCTFGFVTAALAERLQALRGWPPGTRVALRIGRGAVPASADVPLLAPGARGDDDTSAWLEVRRPRPTSGSRAAAGTRPARG